MIKFAAFAWATIFAIWALHLFLRFVEAVEAICLIQRASLDEQREKFREHR